MAKDKKDKAKKAAGGAAFKARRTKKAARGAAGALQVLGHPTWITPHGVVDTRQGELHERIRKQFSKALWDAWWSAILDFKLLEHDESQESPDEADTEDWKEHWKRVKEQCIAAAKERLPENPTQEQLQQDAALHYVQLPNFPNCRKYT